MSFKIGDNNKIELTRGNTLEVTVQMKNNSTGETYTPQAGDVVRFALTERYMTSGGKAFKHPTPIIEKTIPNDTLLLTLLPSDTEDLDFDQYFYNIGITYASGKVDTFIKEAVLDLRPEV